MTRVITWLIGLRSKISRVPPATDKQGGLLVYPEPYDATLDPLSARYCTWRLDGESTTSLARRAGLAISEAIELKSQEIDAMERDLEIVLEYDRWPSCR